ncbi:MAG TPA: DUF1501 domain-containing protein [Gemmataceae bacterium]|nr:DUF1501 domain-containing protein [Gemmataceae bacterium]
MLQFEGKKGVEFCDGLTRRDFLRVGSLSAGAVSLSLVDLLRLQQARASSPSKDINCILLFLVGGPSHLDTFDPKPNAPSTVRGPFKPIKTNVAGIHISEHLPLMAKMADQYALVRSVHHDQAPIHETGHQLMQTGHLFRAGKEYPHYGSVISHLKGYREVGVPPSVVLPGPIGNTGVSVSHGQSAGFLGAKHEPLFFSMMGDPQGITISSEESCTSPDLANLENGVGLAEAMDISQRNYEMGPGRNADGSVDHAFSQIFSAKTKKAFDLESEKDPLRARYGHNTFGQTCLLSRRLIEQGVRMVTINMFDTVFNKVTWDCHADGGSLPTTLNDYKSTLCPMFDIAYSALLDDLKQRGMLGTTLVVAMGEFGRTPKLNLRGGRDHWPGCWSVLFAGAGIKGGQVIGSSDSIGAEPKDRPVSPVEVAATIYEGIGIDSKTRIKDTEGRTMPLAETELIEELFN